MIKNDMFIGMKSGAKLVVRYTDDSGDRPINIRRFPIIGNKKLIYLSESDISKKDAIKVINHFRIKSGIPDLLAGLELRISNNNRKAEKNPMGWSHKLYPEQKYTGGDITKMLLSIRENFDKVGIYMKTRGRVELRMTRSFAQKNKIATPEFATRGRLYSNTLDGRKKLFKFMILLSPEASFYLAQELMTDKFALSMRLLAFADEQLPSKLSIRGNDIVNNKQIVRIK